jgi:plastocyanin
MRSSLALFAFLALTALACSDSTSSANLCTNSGAAVTVDVKEYAFTPSAVTITVGQSVCWANTGNMTHTVTQGSAGQIPLFNGNLPAGQTFVFTINVAGTFGYHCNNHSNMTGTVMVN